MIIMKTDTVNWTHPQLWWYTISSFSEQLSIIMMIKIIMLIMILMKADTVNWTHPQMLWYTISSFSEQFSIIIIIIKIIMLIMIIMNADTVNWPLPQLLWYTISSFSEQLSIIMIIKIQGYIICKILWWWGGTWTWTLSAWGLGVIACRPSEGPTWPYNPESDS